MHLNVLDIDFVNIIENHSSYKINSYKVILWETININCIIFINFWFIIFFDSGK